MPFLLQIVKPQGAPKGKTHMKRKLPDTMFEEANWSTLMETIGQHLSQRNNVNVVKTLTNNVNDNVAKNEKFVDMIADKLVRELNNPGARLFYCKVAWKLPENKIYNNLELAKTGKSPQKYFSWLCNREMQ